jgi:biopolymer transport protein ExbD
MRIRVKPARRRLERVTVNLASMIDVSFLLLFYFMVGTMIQDRENRLSAGLQTEAGTGSVGDFQTQNIEVKVADGVPVYVVGTRTSRDRAELLSLLEPLPKTAGVFVKVYGDVPVGFAVSAVQIAHDAGFTQVTYVPAKP